MLRNYGLASIGQQDGVSPQSGRGRRKRGHQSSVDRKLLWLTVWQPQIWLLAILPRGGGVATELKLSL
ncbi:hypothetical protein ACLKA6_004527 [Drosophila palustris]